MVRVLAADHATPWIRDRDNLTIDLHATLPQLRVSAEQAWPILSAHSREITVLDVSVPSLDLSATAMLVALHAAHHGPAWDRARADLLRACEVFDDDCWQAAALVARTLRADAAMGIGLSTVAPGRAVADRLGLRTRPTLVHRLGWSVIRRRERCRAAATATAG